MTILPLAPPTTDDRATTAASVAGRPIAPAADRVPAGGPLPARPIRFDHGQLVRKRCLDLALGIPLALLITPFLLVAGLVLAVQLRGRPWFVHDRLGLDGRVVRIPKLRTLPFATPTYADKTVTELVPVSRFAVLLRAKHLDELPQLYNVVLGQLSLVGPRPLMPVEADMLHDPERLAARLAVPQGCTGLWQISPHQNGLASDHAVYDVVYAAHQSVRLDLWVLWRTALQAVGAPPTDVLHDAHLPTITCPADAPWRVATKLVA